MRTNNLEPLLLLFLFSMGFICWFLTILLSHFGGSKKDIWWAVLFGILGSMCFGVYMKGIPDGLVIGIFIGVIVDLVMVFSGLWTRYGQRRGLKILDKIRRSAENETLRKKADDALKFGTKLYGGDPNDPNSKI
jgi:hypothetical protein